MEELISKEEIEELMAFKGEARGVSFQNTMDFIVKEKGKEGLKKVEEEMEKLGYPIRREDISPMNFYPAREWFLLLVVMQKLLGFDDRKFQELGSSNAKFSIIIRLFMKYFFSIDMIAKQVPKMWQKYYTIGSLRVMELDKEKKWGILRLENFPLHPLLRQDLIGYFSTVIQMVVKDKVSCETRECGRGEKNCHEFVIKW